MMWFCLGCQIGQIAGSDLEGAPVTFSISMTCDSYQLKMLEEHDANGKGAMVCGSVRRQSLCCLNWCLRISLLSGMGSLMARR